MGFPEWQLALYLFICWAVVALVLLKGVSSLGKISYFTALFPYAMLIVLLIRGVTLPGALGGIKFYLTPNFEHIMKPVVWQEAATQIFYSLSCSNGGLIAMASFNKFKNNCLRDALMVPVLNAVTSIFAGFVVFSILGVMAYEKGVEVSEVVDGGPGLVFIAYPEALAKLPLPFMWSILFFLMMLTLGFGSQFSLVETVLTSFQDDFHEYINTPMKARIYRIACCFGCFCLGLPMTTKAGIYLLEVIDYFVAFIALIIISLLEVITLMWIYGFPEFRFIEDVKMIISKPVPVFYKYCWRYVTPMLFFVLIVASIAGYEPMKMNVSEKCLLELPKWALALGWLTALAPLLFIPIWIFYYLHKLVPQYRSDPEDKFTIAEFLKHMKPQVNWGPRNPEHRTGRYAEMTNNIQALDTLMEMQNEDEEAALQEEEELRKSTPKFAVVEEEDEDGKL